MSAAVVVIEGIEGIGRRVLSGFSTFGNATIFLFQSLIALFRPPFHPYLILSQLLAVGAQSTFVISLIGFFTGAVLAVQGEYTLAKFGATAFVGSAVALSLIRELGPVLGALMLIGRAGSAMTAELGIMKITEQVDALKSMSINPLSYLIMPRMVACIIATPLLAAVFIVVGIGGGYVVGVQLLGLSSGTFISQMVGAVSSLDVYSGLIKSVFFGFIIGWVSTYKGYTCGFGAVGVNRATTESVVTSSVAVLVTDYFLTSILTRIFME